MCNRQTKLQQGWNRVSDTVTSLAIGILQGIFLVCPEYRTEAEVPGDEPGGACRKGAEKVEKFKVNCRELTKKWFEGEVTVTKLELWLALSVCVLAGIVHGLRKAPMTHGTMIASNNGNTFSCGVSGKKDSPKTEEPSQEKTGNEEKKNQ